jgi:hypothetical protein
MIRIEGWKRARRYEENMENWEDILHEDHRPTILIDGQTKRSPTGFLRRIARDCDANF